MTIDLTTLIIPFFNIVAGVMGLLIGLKIHKPFKPEKAEKYHIKYGMFFKFGGLGMLFWGIIALIMKLS